MCYSWRCGFCLGPAPLTIGIITSHTQSAVLANVLCHCCVTAWDGHGQVAGAGVVPAIFRTGNGKRRQEKKQYHNKKYDHHQLPPQRQRNDTSSTASRARDRDMAHVGALRQREDALAGQKAGLATCLDTGFRWLPSLPGADEGSLPVAAADHQGPGLLGNAGAAPDSFFSLLACRGWLARTAASRWKRSRHRTATRRGLSTAQSRCVIQSLRWPRSQGERQRSRSESRGHRAPVIGACCRSARNL